MAAEKQAVIKQSYLDIYLKEDQKRPSNRWVVLNHGTSSNGGGVCLDHFRSKSLEDRCVIPLNECQKIERHKTNPYMFELWCEMGHLRFGCSSPKEMNEWIENIHLALADERRENATARELQDKSTKGVVGKGQEIDIESTSSPIEGTFTVTLKRNTSAQKMNLTSAYKLRIRYQDITLLGENPSETIATWAYSQLRNFHYHGECVEIEAGRAAETGPGTFIFVTPCAKDVYSLIKTNVRTLVKQTPSIVCSDPNPYEIPAPSITTLRNKGLHLHHDARARVNEPILQPLPQVERIADADYSNEYANVEKLPADSSACSSLGVTGPSIEDEYVTMQIDNPDKPKSTTTEASKVIRGDDDYAIVVKPKQPRESKDAHER
eukprot:Em0013g570a